MSSTWMCACGGKCRLELDGRVVRRICEQCGWVLEAPRYPEDDRRCNVGPDGRLVWRPENQRTAELVVPGGLGPPAGTWAASEAESTAAWLDQGPRGSMSSHADLLWMFWSVVSTRGGTCGHWSRVW